MCETPILIVTLLIIPIGIVLVIKVIKQGLKMRKEALNEI